MSSFEPLVKTESPTYIGSVLASVQLARGTFVVESGRHEKHFIVQFTPMFGIAWSNSPLECLWASPYNFFVSHACVVVLAPSTPLPAKEHSDMEASICRRGPGGSLVKIALWPVYWEREYSNRIRWQRSWSYPSWAYSKHLWIERSAFIIQLFCLLCRLFPLYLWEK
jgi:hypothetical protein